MKKIFLASRYIFLAMIFIGLSSCEKDKLTLLTGGVWKFSNLTTTSVDEVATAFIAGYKAIHTDATLEFFEDGSFEKDAPLFEEPETGEYELFGENQIVFTIGDAVYTVSLDKVTKDELIYIETYIDGQGSPYPAKFKWTR